jgi:signal transduction histidine kinase
MSVGIAPTTETPPNLAHVEREQVRLAFGSWVQYVDGAPFAVALTVLMSGLVPEIGRANWLTGAAWLTCQFLWTAAGCLTFRFYVRNEARYEPSLWRGALMALWAANAGIWGAALLVFWDTASAVNQAVLCAFGLGVMVTYFFSLAACFPILCAAIGTISVFAWIVFLSYGGTLPYVFMVVFPLFVFLLVNHGAITARKYEEALCLRFQNEALAGALLRANRAKSGFLASVSHDLRTPLNAILGYADMIRQRTLGPIAPATYGSYVEDIHASGTYLLTMIDDLFDLAKIEAGRREYFFAPLHLSQVIRQALALMEPEAASRLVSVMSSATLDLTIKADESALRQIALNLLSNAIKHSRPGGVVLIFCDVLADGRVAFGVKDTGTGMTSEECQRALDPLSQDVDVYTTEGRIAGMGLPIVRGLIEAHQGRLCIESAPGIGSKVWVEFPPERLLRKAVAA